MPDPEMALDRFLEALVELEPPSTPAQEVLANMVGAVRDQWGWLVRETTGYATNELARADHLGWTLALPTEPTCLVLREDLHDDERPWVLARLIVLGNANLPPMVDSYAIAPCADLPEDYWEPDEAIEAEVDLLARDTLVSLGISAKVAGSFVRTVRPSS